MARLPASARAELERKLRLHMAGGGDSKQSTAQLPDTSDGLVRPPCCVLHVAAARLAPATTLVSGMGAWHWPGAIPLEVWRGGWKWL